MVQKRGGLFSLPLGFRQSVLFAVVLVAVGFCIELASTGKGVAAPGWPVNGMVAAILVAVVFFVGTVFRKHPLVLWLGGIPLGLSLIAVLAALSMIGGIVPQDPEYAPLLVVDLGFNRLFASWPFALVCVVFMVNLGLGFVQKLLPFNVANIQFMLFHGGFWIAVTSGLLGSSDLQRIAVPLYEGKETTSGFDRASDSMVELPFGIFLHDFTIEEYAPMLGLYDPSKDAFVPNESRAMLEIKPGMKVSWDGILVDVIRSVPDGVIKSGEDPVAADPAGGVPFAKVRVVHRGAEQTGWINPAGKGIDARYLVVGRYALVLLPGSPKRFSSEVMFTHNSGEKKIGVLEVNKPFDFFGWKIYQAGYDEKAGKMSSLSVAEAVKDPWLPAVYFGFYLMMAGNLLFFWQGMKKNGKK
ncbi:MAG: cytochrome c biogenesis protein ResB [Chlorobium phaeobacteroides]|uniref:ResB-like domain-containing protein n=1 Tax=Chlorobium phaeobacteroides (strain BS1) TaxID=331678 RepID=B3EN80_CHLPB|nr:cytochrome c biogenesis protein ResB [Chlorobium phaeobacteroides]